MIINKIEISNFGSFEGVVEFDLSLKNDGRSVILVGGKNGAGKTTLFTALKLGLYGPVTLGYDETNSSYFRRIKRLINTNSLSKRNVNTYVLINFTLDEERETAQYDVRREWKYENQKLIEKFSVHRNGLHLSEEELESFENYVRVLIPPQLFDLFFFDGEKISEFFLEGNTAKNLRDALLLLCGYDTFDIMAHNYRRYALKADNDLLDEEESTHAALVVECEEVQQVIGKNQERLGLVEQELEDLETQSKQLEKDFRNAGGLQAQEIASLKSEVLSEEKFREEKYEWLKDFANDFLPFLITKNLVTQVKMQISKENQYQKYITIKNALSFEFLKQVIEEEVNHSKIKVIDSNNNDYSNEFSGILARHIDEKIKPDFDVNSFKPIHVLSTDAENDLSELIRSVESRSNDEIRLCKSEIASSLTKTQKLKKKLDVCERNNDALADYSNLIDSVKLRTGELLVDKGKIEAELESLIAQKLELDAKINKSKENLRKARKEKSVFLMCSQAQAMLASFIPKLVETKIGIIKENFLYMFKQLISKQNYVEDVTIDNDFNVTLYRRSASTVGRIKNMLANIGVEAFTSQMGELCMEHIMNRFDIKRKSELEKSLDQINEELNIELPTKVDVNSFSKGEQQIYIMSLYWALIKTSNNEIPFVIDTPYARIDSIHRDRITSRFFPSLSKQVIILSTDEEIDGEYYQIIKPYVAKEFLITYSDQEFRTVLQKKYFFEVAS